ncbi:unnamed protein product [Merluccius merluccius]
MSARRLRSAPKRACDARHTAVRTFLVPASFWQGARNSGYLSTSPQTMKLRRHRLGTARSRTARAVEANLWMLISCVRSAGASGIGEAWGEAGKQ